jgi:hypothetical protein
MKILFSGLLLAVYFQTSTFGINNHTKEIKSYLPSSNEISGWKIIDSPQRYKGDELFLLMDGGADIYLEYGFKQAVNCMYINDANASVKVEIYQMKSPEGAYGIFTNNSGEDGEKIMVGNGGLLTNYGLIFWKNNFMVSITGSNNEINTKTELVNFAKSIDTKIEAGGKRPGIVNILFSAKESPASVKYLRGNLALMNNYQFMADDIFCMKEGVIGNYSDYNLYAFRYDSSEDAKKWFKNAADKIKTNLKFSSFKQMTSSFSFIDKNKKVLTCYAYKNYLLLIFEKSVVDSDQVYNTLKERINSGI